MSAIPPSAVILAAGQGLRFGEQGRLQPKGFIDFGDGPIVMKSIEKILAAGIRDIVIVTGHLASFYQALALDYPGIIRLVHNPAYATSGSMASLACAQEMLTEDFWLFESDLVYESRALTMLSEQTQANAVLLSGATNSGDEVYAEAPGGFLKQLSKRRSDIAELAGELVGISRISQACYRRMLEHAQSVSGTEPKLEYEQALVEAARQLPVFCPLIPDLAWSEIDTVEHWQRVSDLILPLIRSHEGETS
jgi:2-aminoethylphosphonate-pyruvate transaminase